MLVKSSLFSRLKSISRSRPPELDRRQELPPVLSAELVAQFSNLQGSVANYTCETRRSSYPDAKLDITVYDETGALRYRGRQFGSGKVSFWRSNT